VPVSDASNPGRSFVRLNLTVQTGGPNGTGNYGNMQDVKAAFGDGPYTVPAGRVLVIESVSVYCLVVTGQRIIASIDIYSFPLTLVGSFAGPVDLLETAVQIRMYVPAGQAIGVQMISNDYVTNDTSQCNFRAQGHTEIAQ
jgi:hypothetical protein